MISTAESVSNTVLKYSWLKQPVNIPLGRKRNKKVNDVSENSIFNFLFFKLHALREKIIYHLEILDNKHLKK